MKARRSLMVGLVVGLLSPGYASSAPGDITTYAGGGVGDGLPAISASLVRPVDIASDSSGNFFIADPASHRIRKVDASGTITTVAGNGIEGSSGDGGPATSASLRSPRGITVDPSGVFFFAEPRNHRIRKVDKSGTITTVVGNGTAGYSGDGGPAHAARLNWPSDVAVDRGGNLFIADPDNLRIRKVDSSGTITTVAGSGIWDYSGDGGPATDAGMKHPYGVAVDSSGNLYIADTGNLRVRKVDASGTITTVAGNGEWEYSGDHGPAVSASITAPYHVATDAAGALLIADTWNQRIRKVDASGTIETVAGNGTAGFSGDRGPATSASMHYPSGVEISATGTLLIADSANSRIRAVDSTGRINTVAGNGTAAAGYSGDDGPATSARLNRPKGVAVGAAGDLFIADTINHRIRKVSSTGTITTVAGTGVAGYSGDGGPATSAKLVAPTAVASDASGNLYIADSDNDRIRKVSPAGTITTVAGNGGPGFSGDGGPATSAKLFSPRGITLDREGNLFIADTVNNRIRKVSTAGTITTVAGNGISGFSGDGGAPTSAQLRSPMGIAVDSLGDLYIADTANHRIRRVVRGARIVTIAGGVPGGTGDGGPALGATLYYPGGVAVDSLGNLFVADTGNHRIRKITLGLYIDTVAGINFRGGPGDYSGDGGPAKDAALNLPYGVAVDAAGKIFIADTYNSRIRTVAV